LIFLSRLMTTIFLTILLALAPQSRADTAAVQTTWRLLDYMAVDYRGAVADGKVISDSEYAEQAEFAASVRANLAALPPSATRSALLQQADQLNLAVTAKAPAVQVAEIARGLGRALLAAYPVPLAPSTAPDLHRGQVLYAEICASCHGAMGAGDGPAAASFDPKPVAFSDMTRARERSVFGLAQVIEQGLEGTPMPSFATLSSDDRWALAFTVGGFAYGKADVATGEHLWTQNAALRRLFPDLAALTQASQAGLAGQIGEDEARPLLAYLRTHPNAVLPPATATLDIARAHVLEAVEAARAGDRKKAADLALAAYLDGFEPVEPILRARDAALMGRIETAMGEFRAAISRDRPAGDLAAQAQTVLGLLTEGAHALAPQAENNASSFVGAFTILLREGLEALLIVVAMIAFLRKADRSEVLPYVHLGWTTALIAGLLTWVAATYLISISGASRELTEGVGSVFAALVLLSVGIWMHGKAQAGAWQKYIQAKLSHALSKQSAWFLFLLTFVVVYREVFETILFYMALWAEGSHGAVLAGAGTSFLLLAAIAWALLRWSRLLPVGRFFAWSSALLAILAVVLIGKGVQALQEAGLIEIIPLHQVPTVDLLGVFPTLPGIVGQVMMTVALLAGFAWNRRSAARRT
jgi:high-affinity iron transporter